MSSDIQPARRGRVAQATGLIAPLIVFFLVQNAVGLVSLSLVGGLGTAALAGIGIAGAVYGTLLALLFGFDTGLQAVVSRATGAGAAPRAGQALGDTLAVSGPVGAVLALVTYRCGPDVVHLLAPDPAVAAAGIAYLRGEAPSVLFLGLTIPCNAYWIGSGQPRIAFLVTLALAPLQIAITWPLLFGFGSVPSLGALGAGLAVSAATALGVVLQMSLVRRRVSGFLAERPSAAGILAIVKLGWPVSLQQSFLQFGLVLAFAIVSQLGAGATAILNVIVALTTLPIQCATGIGIAAATLVGQALGRGDARDAARWGWQMAFAAAFILAPLGLIALFAPQPLLALFLTDPATRAAAVFPAQLLGASVALDAFVRVLNFTLRGTGATRSAAAIPFVVQWLLQLPLMWWLGVKLHGGFDAVVTVQVVLLVVEAAVLALVWSRGNWAKVRIAGIRAEPAAFKTLQRIAILGGAGAGKSTLARAVGARLALPVFHLDRFIHGPQWSRLPDDVVRTRLADALAGGHWVVDGTYPHLADLTLAPAELVIWIQQPAWRRLLRAWRKTHSGEPRSDIPDGCEEAFGFNYARNILRFGRWTKRTERSVRAATGGQIVCLNGNRAVARFLAALPG